LIALAQVAIKKAPPRPVSLRKVGRRRDQASRPLRRHNVLPPVPPVATQPLPGGGFDTLQRVGETRSQVHVSSKRLMTTTRSARIGAGSLCNALPSRRRGREAKTDQTWKSDPIGVALNAGMRDVLMIVGYRAISVQRGCDGGDRHLISAMRAREDKTRQVRWGNVP
jgi:hypothetical protein